MALADAIFSPAQSKLLTWLYGQPERTFHVNELLRLTGLGSASLQRELRRLDEGGLLASESVGNLRQVRANPASPLYAEIVSLVRKTLGVVALLRDALASFSPGIALAAVYGSVASGTDHAGSDIDLLVVSDALSSAELLPPLLALEGKVGRRIRPTVYTVDEFARRRADPGSFVSKVLAEPLIPIVGNADEPPVSG